MSNAKDEVAGKEEAGKESGKEEPGSSGAAAFAYRDFRLYQMARALVIMGAEAQAVAVAWQVYLITHRAIDLGYTGLALFLPGLIFMLPAGHAADRFDRRAVILVCYSLQLVCTLTLFLFAFRGIHHILPIYAVLFFIGTGRAFSGPASSALVPHLVPKEHFVNAVTWGATIFQLANIAGPALGGILFTLPLAQWGLPHLAGAPVVFLCTLVTLLGFLALIGMLAVRPGRMEHRATTFDILLEGLRYVWRAKLLLGSVSLDLFVVLLGGAVALMPIFAENVLHTGARGLGMLRAAPALGALTVSIAVVSSHPPPCRTQDVYLRCHLRRGYDCFRAFAQPVAVFGSTGDSGCGGHGERGDPLFPAATGDAAFHARPGERGQLPVRGRIERTWRIRERCDGAVDGTGARGGSGWHWFADGDGPVDHALPVTAQRGCADGGVADAAGRAIGAAVDLASSD
jgi:MFS family permease